MSVATLKVARDFLNGNRASVVQVDRVARYIWNQESGMIADWIRDLEKYREQARKILTTEKGWENANH